MMLRVSGVFCAMTVLVVGVLTGVSHARSSAQLTVVANANALATEKGAAIEEYFGRARSILLIASQNPAFDDLYRDPNGVGPIPESNTKTASDIRAALEYFHTLYPDSIGEVCLIDREGFERARVVNGQHASTATLSGDESGSSFFLPTVQLRSGEVFQAAPYVSGDTHEWVISNSTPLVNEGGTATSILHFEVSVESFRHLLSIGTHGEDVQLIDVQTGRVVADSDTPQLVGAPLGEPNRPAVQVIADATTGTSHNSKMLFRRIMADINNQNQWVVGVPLASTPLSIGDVFNLVTISAIVVALLILMFVALSIRVSSARYSASTDELTGLANRDAFLNDACRALDTADQRDGSIAVLVLDLDRFKEVNDSLGHHAGDELLRVVGPRIVGALRHGDLAARFGGDEFAVLLRDVRSPEQAFAAASRILQAVQHPIQIGEMTVVVEISIGLSLSTPSDVDFEILLQQADVAMYAAKRDHLGVVRFSGELSLLKPDRLALFGELKQAIETGGLEVYYQPKVHLRSGQPHGVEALIRWNHPERGVLNPVEFIALAESSSLIGPLTEFVLRQSLGECEAWLSRGWSIPVSINVSARSLRDAAFSDIVRRELMRSGIHPSMLVLEITESSIMTDPVQARRILTELHNIGIQVSIDDFGTGYSSLAYLTSLPIDELKIDCSFVFNITTRSSDSVVARTVVDLGRNLGLRVVAEGVEDAETAAALASFGCDIGQGYFWSRPQPYDVITEWLGERMKAIPVSGDTGLGTRHEVVAEA